jgi:hypothetical protein
LFQGLITETNSQRDLLFRQSDHGAYVLPPAIKTADNDDTAHETSHFLKYLASYSWGIHVVAWSVWRSALRTASDEEVAEEMEPEDTSLQSDTIWVLPWESLPFPSIPDGVTNVHILVLHTLLLHRGLSLAVLSELLPYPSSKMIHALLALKEAALVEQSQDDVWYISATGYPIVR